MRGRCGKSLRVQWRAGIKGYLVGAPLYLGFILLNSRFIWGTFIFNWDGGSWYFSGCYLLFPWVRILWADLARWQSPDYRPPRRHSRDYSQLRRPLHADSADYAGVQLAVAGGEVRICAADFGGATDFQEISRMAVPLMFC